MRVLAFLLASLLMFGSAFAGQMAPPVVTAILGGAMTWSGAAPPPSNDPTVGVLPSYNDASANWKNAGLLSVGGIPNRTTICATVNPGSFWFDLTTASANDILVAYIAVNGASTVTSISSPNTSGWTLRGTHNNGAYQQYAYYYGKAASALTNEHITVTLSGSDVADVTILAIKGANYSSPFDSHSGLPAQGTPPFSISTSNTGTDFIFGMSWDQNAPNGVSGSGWTQIVPISNNYMVNQYQILTGPQTLSVTVPTDPGGYYGFADALVQSGTVALDGALLGQPAPWDTTGTTDVSSILNAIGSCPSGEVVQLASGNFTINQASPIIYINKGIVLRGTTLGGHAACDGSSSPYCATSITVADGWWTPSPPNGANGCGTTLAGANISNCRNGGSNIIMGATASGWSTCGDAAGGGNSSSSCATALAASATQGQTTIRVVDTSPFAVGGWVYIDESDNPSFQTDPIAVQGSALIDASSDWAQATGSPAVGRASYNYWNNGAGNAMPADCGFGKTFCERSTAEIHKIASIGTGPCPGTNCTLTFDDPLTIAYRTSNGALVYYSNPAFVEYAGFENISFLRSNGGIVITHCGYCWVKNSEFSIWAGGALNVSSSARTQLEENYIDIGALNTNGGGEYSMSFDAGATEDYIVNNISIRNGKAMVVRGAGGGSVFAYNYTDDTYYFNNDCWIEMGANASHWTGSHQMLFEGNWAQNLDNDDTWGGESYITYFRNQGSGLRSPFTDLANNVSVNDYTDTCGGYPGAGSNNPGPKRMAGPQGWDYFFAYVGNVLGVSGKTTTAHGWLIGNTSGSGTATQTNVATGHGAVWMSGWKDGGAGTWTDPRTNSLTSSDWMFRHGDYNYVTASIPDWTTGYSHTLPNSFYLTSAPAAFSSGSGYSWPWVTPTGSPQVQSGPTTTNCTTNVGGPCSGLPAKARWDNGTPFVQP